jgi:hypothetical protein
MFITCSDAMYSITLNAQGCVKLWVFESSLRIPHSLSLSLSSLTANCNMKCDTLPSWLWKNIFCFCLLGDIVRRQLRFLFWYIHIYRSSTSF